MDITDFNTEELIQMRGSRCASLRTVKGGKKTRCWSVDYASCPGCAGLNALYKKKLISSGFRPDDNYYFWTLTAPSFGPVNNDGTPRDKKRYRYGDQVVWNHNSTLLWGRTWKAFSQLIPDAAFASVREYQTRGVIHLHTLVRVPGGTSDTAVRLAVKRACKARSGGLGWGKVSDLRLVKGDALGDTARYFTKVLGYTTKRLGKSIESDLSMVQKEFYKKLDDASIRENYKPGAVAGFGYGGHVFTTSGSWSDLTLNDFKEETRRVAADAGPGPDLGGLDSVIADRQREDMDLRALARGNRQDYNFNEAAARALLDRVRGWSSWPGDDVARRLINPDCADWLT